MKNKANNKLKLKIKFDRVLHSIIHNKHWTKWWNWCNKKNINYYLIMALAKMLEKTKNFKFEDYNFYGLGHSHLDAAWFWTKISTIRKVIITCQQNFKLFEKYPYYKFSQTTPLYYDWIRRLRPELFEKIKEYEKKGQWEIIGGMWVEPDLNLPNGESLVRQRLYGQLFFLEHFRKIAHIESIEDTFGFNAQMPQILKKSGAHLFWTAKMSWNDTNDFLLGNFIWRGLDGSEIFTHSCRAGIDKLLLNIPKNTKPNRIIKTQNKIFNYSYSTNQIESHYSEKKIKTTGLFYGFGDGGLGPIEEEIALIESMIKRQYLKIATYDEFFKILQEECGDNLPIWDDELYLEYHRGVFTSQVNIKRLNRESEINLRNAEIILTLLDTFSSEFNYPVEEMKKSWKLLLFNQFHDILPGSSIQDVYYEQEKELEELIQKVKKLISTTLQTILSNYSKNLGDLSVENHVILMNTLSWERDGIIQIDDKEIKIEKILPLSLKIINKSETLEQGKKVNESNLKIENLNNKIIMTNELISLSIDKITGHLTSIKWKKNDREFITLAKGIGIHVFKEKKTKHPAWNIYKNYSSLPVDIGGVRLIQIVEDTSSIKKVKLLYRFKNTEIYHYISLRENSDMIYFKTDIDVKNKWLLFKIRFPFNLESKYLQREIPYGYMKKRIIAESDYEKAQWEFPAQKYVDISESEIGISLVNNSKYGFSSSKRGLDLTILHTPPRPSSPFYSYLKVVPRKKRTKYVDIGYNSTEYALWIHEGDFFKSKAWRKGYEYNYPIVFHQFDQNLDFKSVQINKKYIDSIKNGFKFASIENSNIIFQVIKLPEEIILKREEKTIDNPNNSCLIIRLFETSGKAQENVEIIFNDLLYIKNAISTDLLERHLINEEITIVNHQKLVLNFGKFEIKTIKLIFSLK